MLDSIFLQAPVYLLIFGRIFSMLMVLPLFSMRAAPRIAKIALAGYMAFFILGTADLSVYKTYLGPDGVSSLQFVLLLAGEVLIGVILGFFIQVIFSSFSSAGQFIAFQMGLGAASAYDSLSQVENPLMGQFFNLVAMLVFLQTKYFQKLFIGGLATSFDALNAIDIVMTKDHLLNFMLKGLTSLFADALVIALPVMGTLFIINVCVGLLTKAAPQMNLLSEGFPIMIIVAFSFIAIAMPYVIDFFIRSPCSTCTIAKPLAVPVLILIVSEYGILITFIVLLLSAIEKISFSVPSTVLEARIFPYVVKFSRLASLVNTTRIPPSGADSPAFKFLPKFVFFPLVKLLSVSFICSTIVLVIIVFSF